MLTIIMDSDKSLHLSGKNAIHQKENLVDVIQFLVPQTYESESLMSYTAKMIYKDKASVVHRKQLTPEQELYNNTYIQYIYRVDSEFTDVSGEIEIELSFEKEQNMMYTDTIKLDIKPLPSWFVFEAPPSNNTEQTETPTSEETTPETPSENNGN